MKQLLILLLLFFVIGCGCPPCRDGMTLIYQGTIEEINIFNGLSGDYMDIFFNNNHSALLPTVLGDTMEEGQSGCLYFDEESIIPGDNYIYYWYEK